MNKELFWTKFPLGSHLCREPMPPMDEMLHDMEILKAKGFNLIKLQLNWMLDEPREGVYEFSKYQTLIEHAQKLDMGVYIGLTCEQAPNWLWKKHPGCRMELRDGRTLAYQAQSTLPADGKPGPCFDDPGAMQDMLRYIRVLASTLGVNENIIVWNTWQEAHYWGERFAGGYVCYCPATIKAYQIWLEELYEGSIDSLNAHWNTRYSVFEHVLPDRCIVSQCIPQTFFFKYFMDNIQLTGVLAARYDAIKKADPLGRPVFAHKGWPEVGSGMDWSYAQAQDFLGTSFYPAWGSGHKWDDNKQHSRIGRFEAFMTEMWDNVAYRMDYLRSASKDGAPVWAAEFQGGPVSTDFFIGRVPDSSDIRRWMLTSLGAGATAIVFWVTRAEIMAPESNGFALLDSEGNTTERLEEASRIGLALQQYPDIFAMSNKPRAEIAILIDEWKYQLMHSMSFVPDAHLYDLRGWYKYLWDMGIPCDFIEAAQLDEKAAGYKTIIVPLPLSMSDEVANGLVRFADAGGHVILEGGCGRLSETAYAVRGQMNGVIRSALDIKAVRYKRVYEPEEPARWSIAENTWGDYEEPGFLEGTGLLKGTRLRANYYIETYDEDFEHACFMWNDKPTGIVRNVGKGSILLVGTCIGPNATAYVEKDSFDTVAELLKLTGVTDRHKGRLLISERRGRDRKALIITNPLKERITEKIEIPCGCTVKDLFENDIAVVNGAVEVTLEPLDVSVIIVRLEG